MDLELYPAANVIGIIKKIVINALVAIPRIFLPVLSKVPYFSNLGVFHVKEVPYHIWKMVLEYDSFWINSRTYLPR